MTVTVELGGVDRTILCENPTWTYIADGRGSGELTVVDEFGGFAPVDGMPAIIKEDGTALFAGALLNPRRAQVVSGNPVTYKCMLVDYAYLTDKRPCQANYPRGKAFRAIVDGLVSQLSGDSVTVHGDTPIAADGPVIHDFLPIGLTVSEALTRLMTLAEAKDGNKYVWWIDVDKKLHAVPLPTDAFPANLTTINSSGKKLNRWQERSGYVNTVTVRSGTADSEFQATERDAGEITARATIEGGSGIHHKIIDIPGLTSDGQCRQAAVALLSVNKDMPVVADIETLDSGYAVGQQGTVHLPTIGLNAQTMNIGKVVAKVIGMEQVVYTLTAISEGIVGVYPITPWIEWWTTKSSGIRPPLGYLLTPADGDDLSIGLGAGAIVADPTPAPTEWTGAAQSGVLDETPSILGIDDDEAFMLTLRRDAGANEHVFERWAIVNHVVATTPTDSTTWAEFAANANFKSVFCIEPKLTGNANRYAAYTQYGAPGKLGIVNLVTPGLEGSVASTMSAQGNGGEPVWTKAGYIYIPDVTTAKVFIFDARVPSAPIAVGSFLTSLTDVHCLKVNSDETYMFAFGTGGIVSLDLADPEVLVEDDTLAPTGSYVSGAINAAGTLLGCATRVDANNVRVTTVDVAGSTLTLNTEKIVPLVTAAMLGTHAMLSYGALIVWSAINATDGANSLEAQVFDLTSPDFVEHIETISYVHGAAGNIGPVNSLPARASIYTFVSNTDAQITWGAIAYNEIVRRSVETMRAAFGGTGHGGPGDEYMKGEILVATDVGTLGKLTVGSNGQVMIADSAETPGVKYGDVEDISTALAAGSVIFSDGTNLAEDNANFFWDDANNELIMPHLVGSVASGGGLKLESTQHATKGIINLGDALYVDEPTGQVNIGGVKVHSGALEIIGGRLVLANNQFISWAPVSGGPKDIIWFDNTDQFRIVAPGVALFDAVTRFSLRKLGGGAYSVTDRHVWDVGGAEAMRLDDNKTLFIDDTVNANMTIGLTRNQGTNDNQISCDKSDDVVTVLTTAPTANVETDDFYTLQKKTPLEGGVLIQALCEDGGAAETSYEVRAYGATADTTKTTAGTALIYFYASEHDGANALVNVTADGNVFGIGARVGGADISLWLLDEGGNSWQSGAAFSHLQTTNVTANVTLDDTHTVVFGDAVGGLFTVTVPAVAGIAGRHYYIHKIDPSGNPITIDVTGGGTINGSTTLILASQDDAAHLVASSAEWRIQ